MQAVEFNTASHKGIIKIPESYKDWFEKSVKVILLTPEEETNPQSQLLQKKTVRAFFENIHIDLKGYRFNRDEANER